MKGGGRVKKILLLIVSLLFVLMVSGCAQDFSNKDDNPPINPRPLSQGMSQDMSKEISLYFFK